MAFCVIDNRITLFCTFDALFKFGKRRLHRVDHTFFAVFKSNSFSASVNTYGHTELCGVVKLRNASPADCGNDKAACGDFVVVAAYRRNKTVTVNNDFATPDICLTAFAGVIDLDCVFGSDAVEAIEADFYAVKRIIIIVHNVKYISVAR